MKKIHLLIVVCLATVVPAFSQERPRFFDNFDTAHGVQVYRPPTIAAAKPKAAPAKTSAKTPDTKRLVKKTVQTKMNAAESYALADTPRTKLTMGTSSRLNGFTTGDPVIDSYIVDSSHRYGIDPLLIYSQMHQESSFKLRATSPKGASGLMQLMPATARRLGVTNIYDPKQNIDGGVKYMRLLLDMFGGDVNLALAGYNAGEGAVMKYGNQIPPYSETREYVRRISTRYSEIANPTFARTASRVNNAQAAKLSQKESRPLTMYEPNPMAIRLADGRMRLVNQ